MNKVLLLGGFGFIGHNLSLYLKRHGYEVSIADSLKVNNLKSPEKKTEIQNQFLNQRSQLINEKKIKNYLVDLNDKMSMQKIIDENQPNILIHLAAVSHAKESNLNPHKTFLNNLNSVENILEIVKKNRHIRFIFFSSSMVYGNFETPEVNENSNCKPIGIYGSYKYSAELMIKAYSEVFGLKYNIIRPSALYGERCISRRVGQIFIENAINNKPIFIDGDGSEKLDFTYIEDLCDGVEKIISQNNSSNETFNITFGNSRKISDLVDILKLHFENLRVEFKKRDKLMPFRGTLSNDKAKKILNFTPNFPIEKGYESYIKWYKSINN